MKDNHKTKTQLLRDIDELRQHVHDLSLSEKALREREDRYRSFVENVGDACVEFDLKGKCTFCNEAAFKLLGYTRETYMQLSHRQRYPSREAADRDFRFYNEIYTTDIPLKIFETELRHKDGHVVVHEISASPIRDEAGQIIGFRGIGRDITDRKKLEAEQARYRDYVENLEDLCFETDLRGNITFVNESACLRLGYANRNQLLGMNNRLYSKPPEAKKMADAFKELYRTGIPTKIIDFEVLDAKSNPRIMQISVSLIRDMDGTPTGFRGLARDITELKRLEEAQARSADFIANVEDGCFETDLEGFCTFCNEAIVRLMGYSREEIMKMNYKAYTTPEEGRRIVQLYAEMLRTGNPVKIYNHEMICKGGERRFADISASIIRNADGKPVGFRGINRDVTERRNMEKEQEHLKEQLNQAQKLEAIGTLAGGVAHDFNNLLMGIQGYASLMLLDKDSSHPDYEKLRAIEMQVRSGADLTKQLLGYARGGRYEIKPTNMNDLIEKAAAMFGRTRKEIRIHRKPTRDLWNVEVDRGQIEQMLLNLFLNAWQAMPGGGSLYLETENVVLSESFTRPHGMKSGHYVKISVTDTGVGMDENTRTRIFEPFFTTKEMGHGSGLGLASAYGIIKGHEGMITVYSEKGHGTTFNIYLPVSGKEVIEMEQRAHKMLRGLETVLLVDDEQIIRDVTGAMLNGLGYEVLIARSGEEAIDIYKVNRDRIAIVIMDMIMPGMGGGMVFDRLKTMNPAVRVILSSGYSLDGEANEIMERGCRAFLQKPFQFDELSQKIRQIIDMQYTEG